MPVSFRILKDHGLVYVRYEGVARMEDTARAFAEYAAHPDCETGQKQLVDLSGVTEVERDYPELMKLQAQKADVFLGDQTQTIIVYLAPTPTAQAMSHMVLKSWEPFPWIVPVILQTEAEALEILGLRETSLSELLPTIA